VQEVYALAADIGGMGFIFSHHAQILSNNGLVNIHTLEAARRMAPLAISTVHRPASTQNIARPTLT
jgi:hypothetical protein